MRNLLAMASALALGFSTLAASAKPIDPTLGADASANAHVAYGCGRGMHRGPHGGCQFDCPRGWHPSPDGFNCFRNHY